MPPRSPLSSLVLLATISILPDVVPQDVVPPQLWRKLLQDPASPGASEGVNTATPGGSPLFLNLCETSLCESQRPDGVCDRWARNDACSRRDIFFVSGDPGENEKAEMFFNLRSPWDISCSLGRCTPLEGAVYDVFVAENCIPEQDFVTEMQDVSVRTSKQVKIYLRRKANFYISITRKEQYIGSSENCTYGITAGSIESAKPSRCFDFKRLSETDIAASNVPNCRDVMPVFENVVSPDTSTQVTFVVALIGVGLLSIALIVLAFILIRRFRRGRKRREKVPQPLNSIRYEGLQPGSNAQADKVSGATPESPPRLSMSKEKTPRDSETKSDAPGTHSRKQRERLAKRIADFDKDEDDFDEGGLAVVPGEPGTGAGLIEDAPHIKKGVGSGRLIFGGKGSREPSGSSGSGSSGSDKGDLRTPSPADEMQRSLALAKQFPGSPSRKVPSGKKARDGSERGGSAGSAQSLRSVRDTDLDVMWKGGRAGESGAPRPGTGSSTGSAALGAGWGDEAGIRIDDILEEAKKASPSPRKDGHSPSRPPGASPQRPPHENGALPPSGRIPAAPPGVRPAIAPLMAARLGLPSPGASPGPGSIGSGMRVPPTAQPPTARRTVPITFTSSPPRADPGWGNTGSVDRDSLVPPAAGRAVALSAVPPRDLPKSSQPGVPPPPPRPHGLAGLRPLPGAGFRPSVVGSTPANTGSLSNPPAPAGGQPFNPAGVVVNNANALGTTQPLVLGARPGGPAATSGDGRAMATLGSNAASRRGSTESQGVATPRPHGVPTPRPHGDLTPRPPGDTTTR